MEGDLGDVVVGCRCGGVDIQRVVLGRGVLGQGQESPAVVQLPVFPKVLAGVVLGRVVQVGDMFPNLVGVVQVDHTFPKVAQLVGVVLVDQTLAFFCKVL